jgi:ABC-2 type transport system ATP-binding protein
VANGSLEELRAGVALQSLDGGRATQEKLTLEEIFLNIVGKGQIEAVPELSWLA